MSYPSLFRRFSVILLFCTPVLFIQVRAAQTGAPPVQIQHPLDPLTAAEIETAAKVLTAAPQFPAEAQFATIVLKEPPKSEVLSYTPGTPITRQAFAVILDRKRNRAFEAVVDVKAPRVVSWIDVKGVQPAVLEHEYDVLVDIVKKDPRWQAAMRKRGINDFDKVQIDNWAVGQVAPRYQKQRRRAAPTAQPRAGREVDRRPRGAQSAHHHSARRRELHRHRPGDSLAEMALPLSARLATPGSDSYGLRRQVERGRGA